LSTFPDGQQGDSKYDDALPKGRKIEIVNHFEAEPSRPSGDLAGISREHAMLKTTVRPCEGDRQSRISLILVRSFNRKVRTPDAAQMRVDSWHKRSIAAMEAAWTIWANGSGDEGNGQSNEWGLYDFTAVA
jgi:hypothetical protein